MKLKNSLLHKSTLTMLAIGASVGAANAVVLSQWTFNNTSSVAAALASSGTATGITVSGLVANTNGKIPFGTIGAGAPSTIVPFSTENDGYGFQSTNGSIVLRRVFNSDETKTTMGLYSSSAVSVQPFSFTLTANSGFDVTLNSITATMVSSNNALTFGLQEASNSVYDGNNVSDFVGGTDTLTKAVTPITVTSGNTKTITLFLSSGSYDSINEVNSFLIDGTVTAIPEPSSAALLGLGAVGFFFRRRR